MWEPESDEYKKFLREQAAESKVVRNVHETTSRPRSKMALLLEDLPPDGGCVMVEMPARLRPTRNKGFEEALSPSFKEILEERQMDLWVDEEDIGDILIARPK